MDDEDTAHFIHHRLLLCLESGVEGYSRSESVCEVYDCMMLFRRCSDCIGVGQMYRVLKTGTKWEKNIRCHLKS